MKAVSDHEIDGLSPNPNPSDNDIDIDQTSPSIAAPHYDSINSNINRKESNICNNNSSNNISNNSSNRNKNAACKSNQSKLPASRGSWAVKSDYYVYYFDNHIVSRGIDPIISAARVRELLDYQSMGMNNITTTSSSSTTSTTSCSGINSRATVDTQDAPSPSPSDIEPNNNNYNNNSNNYSNSHNNSNSNGNSTNNYCSPSTMDGPYSRLVILLELQLIEQCGFLVPNSDNQ